MVEFVLVKTVYCNDFYRCIEERTTRGHNLPRAALKWCWRCLVVALLRRLALGQGLGPGCRSRAALRLVLKRQGLAALPPCNEIFDSHITFSLN